MSSKRSSPRPTGQPTGVLPLVWMLKPHLGKLSIGFAAMLVTTACMLTIPQYLKHTFDKALVKQDIAAMNDLMLVAGAVILVLVVGVFVRTYFIQYTCATMVGRFREKLFAHILKFDVLFYETFGVGEVISRMVSDVVVMREFVQFAMPALLRGTLLAIGTLALLLLTNTMLTVTLFAVGAPIALLAVVLGKKWRHYARDIQQKSAELASIAEESIYAIRTLQAYGREDTVNHLYHTTMNEGLWIGRRLIVSNGVFFSISLLVGFSGVLFVLWLGGREVIEGTMTLGDMMAYLLYLAFLGDAVSSLANFYPALQQAAGATERVFELMQLEPEITDPAKPTTLPSATSGRAVAFEGVMFTYPSRPEQPALQDYTLHIKAGEQVALVGPSGAGKSTLFSLLLRFYEAQTGQIKLDNVAVDQLKLADLRGTMAYVAQESTIFSTTIEENIRYGNPAATEADIHAAAKLAHADDFITKLPDGYSTQVGERGVRLSGGQKQRLAIARAIVRNPSILLLDEATSHLDAASEQAVQAAFEKIKQNRTTLVIAHRLATVQAADRIIVMEEGRIVAEGTHNKLMKTSPLYKSLAELQFLGE